MTSTALLALLALNAAGGGWSAALGGAIGTLGGGAIGYINTRFAIRDERERTEEARTHGWQQRRRAVYEEFFKHLADRSNPDTSDWEKVYQERYINLTAVFGKEALALSKDFEDPDNLSDDKEALWKLRVAMHKDLFPNEYRR